MVCAENDCDKSDLGDKSNPVWLYAERGLRPRCDKRGG